MLSAKNWFVVALLASPSAAFTVSSSPTTFSASTVRLGASVETQDDLLKPAYDVEPIPIRIGHGFDIHRMAPIELAGQPIVIGGVIITHKDQKVRD
jgi:2-C-methyl-D-erythritol 2,4-cyclodiphosphate synthase